MTDGFEQRRRIADGAFDRQRGGGDAEMMAEEQGADQAK
jgi:hypothetical protein